MFTIPERGGRNGQTAVGGVLPEKGTSCRCEQMRPSCEAKEYALGSDGRHLCDLLQAMARKSRKTAMGLRDRAQRKSREKPAKTQRFTQRSFPKPCIQQQIRVWDVSQYGNIHTRTKLHPNSTSLAVDARGHTSKPGLLQTLR